MTVPSFSFGLSPCPNDTYIFDALLHGRIPVPFTPAPHISDVEELNALARSGALAISKISAAAAAQVLEKYILLNSGGALGRGCGPLLVSRKAFAPEDLAGASVAVPGRLTTANLLLSLHGGFKGPRAEMLFDRVMPSVLEGKADLGLIIHEGRFTYAERGLRLVLDLGAWWEEHTGLPIPLGVIAVRRDLGTRMALFVEDAIRRSLLHARAHPEACREFVSANAQEMEPSVMTRHIDTFVNDFSLDLGAEGREAVLRLLRAAARETGLGLPDLPVFAERDAEVAS